MMRWRVLKKTEQGVFRSDFPTEVLAMREYERTKKHKHTEWCCMKDQALMTVLHEFLRGDSRITWERDL